MKRRSGGMIPGPRVPQSAETVTGVTGRRAGFRYPAAGRYETGARDMAVQKRRSDTLTSVFLWSAFLILGAGFSWWLGF